MASFATPAGVARSRRGVRPALLVALALSLLLHAGWSLWPVEPAVVAEEPVLIATLVDMPPPPTAVPERPAVEKRVTKPTQARPRRAAHPRVITAPNASDATQATVSPPSEAVTDTDAGVATSRESDTVSAATDAAIGPPTTMAPPVELPPRLELAYKVYFGTRGFVIGDATYRFEHQGDRYRISTVGQARGLAALFVHGKGRVESAGRITSEGLKPYEFAIERGSADKREVAHFDWDAGNVVLNDGALATLAAPAYDPLTILWQPYFSPPSRDDRTFSLATTRRVARYTLTLEGVETIKWPRGQVETQRWHQVSEDGKTEGWFWLAPSLHYIPVKMRVTRTSRGTLEAVLDAIRGDDVIADGGDTSPETIAAENTPFRPWDPMAPVPGSDAHGQ